MLIKGEKVFLTPYESNADIIRFCTWARNKELVFQFAPSLGYPVTFEMMKRRIKLSKTNYKCPMLFKVNDINTGGHIGHAEITRSHIDLHSHATLSHLLIADYQYRSKGFGTDLVRTLLQYLFVGLQLNRVELFVLQGNLPAIVCYQKCGFNQEGILRQCLKFEEQYYNLSVMSILKNEWFDLFERGKENKQFVKVG